MRDFARRFCEVKNRVFQAESSRREPQKLTAKRKMILTTCAACAAPLAHNAPRCVRCWTRYCDSTCQQCADALQGPRHHARRSPRGLDDARGLGTDRAASARWRTPDHNGNWAQLGKHASCAQRPRNATGEVVNNTNTYTPRHLHAPARHRARRGPRSPTATPQGAPGSGAPPRRRRPSPRPREPPVPVQRALVRLR